MTRKQNSTVKVLRFGDFIAAAFRSCGSRRAKELVRVAVNSNLIQFRGQQRYVISGE